MSYAGGRHRASSAFFLLAVLLSLTLSPVALAESSTAEEKPETFLSKVERKAMIFLSAAEKEAKQLLSSFSPGSDAEDDAEDEDEAEDGSSSEKWFSADASPGDDMICVATNVEDGSCIFMPGPNSKADRRELRGEFLGPIGYESSEKYMTPRCQQPAELHHFPADYKYMTYNTSMPVPGHAPATSATAVKSITGMFGRKLLAAKSRKAARKTSKRRRKPQTLQQKMEAAAQFRKLATPKARDFAFFEHAFNNMPGFCPFAVKECARPGVKAGVMTYKKGQGQPCCNNQDNSCCRIHKPFPMEKEALTMSEWEAMPSIPAGSWGSCAFVALGNNMIHTPRGAQIDHHDLVIRLGHAPVKEFAKYVGSRTDVVLSRGVGSRMRSDMAQEGTKFYIGSNAGTGLETLKGFEVDYPPINYTDLKGPAMSPRHLASNIYSTMTTPLGGKPRGGTTGFHSVLRQIYTNFCSRLDLFGFSADGGPGYYSDAAAPMKLHHASELESWSLHHIMKHYEELNTCVYL